MSILKTVVYDGFAERQVAIGDTVAATEVLPAAVAANTATITGAQLAGGFIQRTVTAGGTDTIDTAANIIAGTSSGMGSAGVQNGTTVRVRWLVTGAFAVTVQATANTGVTVTNGTVAAGAATSWKDFLVTYLNGSPMRTAMVTTTNASAILTGMTAADTANVTVGMIVTNAINGLQGLTVLSVQQGVGVTLSGNANATSTTQVAVTFSPQVTLVGIGSGVAL